MPSDSLTSYPTVPNSTTYLPGGSGSSSGGIDWGGLGTIAGGAGALLGSLFAPKSPNIDPEIAKIDAGATGLTNTGQALSGQGQATTKEGQAALAPALKYFQALVSGDPSAILQATQPERSRVIDQYDAARRSSAQFTPRGGGQASSQMNARASEARDLATTTNTARSGAASSLASIGTALSGQGIQQTGQGLSAEEIAQNSLAATLGPILQKAQQDKQSTTTFFSGLADVASIALGFL